MAVNPEEVTPKIRQVEKDGKHYLAIGNMAIEVDANGEPVRKGYSTRDADGNLTFHAPCLRIVAEQHEPN